MIDLPEYPAPQSVVPSLVDFGSTLRPSLGGKMQRINRLGNRFAIDITMPPMKSYEDGRKWLSKLLQGKSEGVRMRWPKMGLKTGDTGVVHVDGSGQSGSTLLIKNARPSHAFKEGQFFSVETAGDHYLYNLTEQVLVDVSGDAALPIVPMLRAEHLDGDICHFSSPMFQGFIEGDELSWEYAIGNFTSFSFRIEEAG